MKKITALVALVLTVVLLLTACSLFAPSPEKQILGKWMDSANMQGFEFFEDGKVTLTYLNFTIPILNVPYNGTIDGAYTLDKEEKTISINATIVMQSFTKTYQFEISGTELKLTDVSDNKTTSFFKVTNQPSS